ncbi:MAG: vWA domain-containing protein [Bacteriovoracaceae bacterium]|nr:VWA domain-containing protein [Bacteroidota bacterium]
MKRTFVLLTGVIFAALFPFCEKTITDSEGKEMCLDEYIAKTGKDRSLIEEEARSRGIEASAVLLELYKTVTGVADVIFDCGASQLYDPLCDSTGGEYSKAGTPTIALEKIEDYIGDMPQDSIDLVFMLDATGSMSDDILEVKKKLSSIIAVLSGKYARISMVMFRDKNVDSVWYARNTNNLIAAGSSELPAFLGTIQPTGGGDFPESMFDAAHKTITELQWKSKGRLLVVMTDAGPLTGSKTQYTLQNITDLCIEKKVVPFVVLVSVK